MKLCRLKTNANSYRLITSNSITGVIYFEFDDFQFPENNWNDFVVVVLSWWLTAIYKLVSGQSTTEELRFMDGPFSLKIKSLNSSLWEIECFSIDKKMYNNGQYYSADFISSVLVVAKSIIKFCDERNLISEDIERLKKNFNSLFIRAV